MTTMIPTHSIRTTIFTGTRLLTIALSLAATFFIAASARADSPTPYNAGVSGPFKDQAAQLESSVNLGQQLLDALNQNCDPKIDLPSPGDADAAYLDLDAAESAMNAAEEAVKGPADADKSDEYKQHEAALKDAERRLEKVGKEIDKYVKAKNAAAAAGDPPPHLLDRTIDAYDKAKADLQREQSWLDKSPEMTQFNKDLPKLKKELEAAQHTYDLAARDYVNALGAYDAALWDSIIRAAGCQPVTNETVSTTAGTGADQANTDTETASADQTDPTPVDDVDSDGDGLSDGSEARIGTNPNDPDSDHEGLSDGDEVNTYGTDPLNADTDGDGIDDEQEVHDYFTDPHNPDTDGDGVTDGVEVQAGSDPTDPASLPGGHNGDSDLPDGGGSDGGHNGDGDLPAGVDSDGDGLSDREEIEGYGTNPESADTDGDGYTDGDEIMVYLTSPLDPNSHPEASNEAQG
jgi:hypothetical protein